MYAVRILLLSVLAPSFCALWATTFQAVPLEDLVDESEAFVHGVYTGYEYTTSESGRVVTRHTIEALAVAGLGGEAGGDYTFFTRGGIREGGIAVEVQGAPRFRIREEVVVLLGDAGGSFFVSNLAAGKFEVYERGGRKFLKNAAFPDDEGLSDISLESFYETARNHFGSGLRIMVPAEDEAVQGGGAVREPGESASDPPVVERTREPRRQGGSLRWVVIVAVLGAIAYGFYRLLK